MNRCLVILMCAGAAASASAGGDEPALVQRSGPATLRTTAPLEKNVVVLPFTEELTLLVELQGGDGLEVQPPAEWTKAPWKARLATPPVRQAEANRIRWMQTLLLEPQTPGESSLVLAPLKLRESPDGEWRTIAWHPIAVRVTTKLTQPDLKSARDITAIEELPAPPPRESRLGLWLAAILVSVAGLGTWALLWRRRSATRPRATPEAWASYELDRLHALGLPERGGKLK